MESITNKLYKENDNFYCTVFTATYNRAYILDNLYNSLCVQVCKDFEWLIVDDGSTDDTKSKIIKWIEDDIVPIRYVRKENGGKHTAINLGTDLAKGTFFFMVDSDDYITDNAIQFIKENGSSIMNINFAGISGTRIHSNGEVIGMKIDKEYIDATNLQREHYGLTGDKAEVYLTEVLKKYKFPVVKGERFIHESIVYNHIAKDNYKIRWYNQPLVVCDYIEDGLTKNAEKINKENPRGYLLALEADMRYFEPSLLKKIYYYYARYYNFSKIVANNPFQYTKKKCKTNTLFLGISIMLNKIKNILKKGEEND